MFIDVYRFWANIGIIDVLRPENKDESLEGRFLDEKLPFLHKKKAEHSFELFFPFFVLTVYF